MKVNEKRPSRQVAWHSGPLPAGTGLNMLSSLLLLALLILPSAWAETVEEKIDEVADWVAEALNNQVELSGGLGAVGLEVQSVGEQLETLLADSTLQSTEIREPLAIVGATQNATSQLRTELDTLRGRQAASAAVQASQVLMLVVYFLTIISIYVVKRCRKVREKAQRKEFELLVKQLRSSKAKRRAAAAKEKSAPAPSQE